MKIFVVNLERAAERRVAILRHLAELGLEAEILPAVEGARVDRASLGPDAEPGLSNGEVGCYLSHVRFWQTVVERRLPHAIILEDDVICSPTLMRVADEIAALDLPWDAVRLSALQPIRGIPLLTLSPLWEQEFARSLTGDGEDKQLAMAPSKLPEFINALRNVYERHAMMGEVPVLTTS